MPVYISYEDKTPTGVLLADSREKATIAFTGMYGKTPSYVEEINYNGTEGVHSVVFLLTSQVHQSHEFREPFEVRVWKRGL